MADTYIEVEVTVRLRSKEQKVATPKGGTRGKIIGKAASFTVTRDGKVGLSGRIRLAMELANRVASELVDRLIGDGTPEVKSL
jgi:hypothetical protein